MKDSIEERSIEIANYIIEINVAVRRALLTGTFENSRDKKIKEPVKKFL